MDHRTYMVSLPKNPLIAIEMIPGHFATGRSHVSHYINMSGLKSIASVAKEVAKEMAIPYLTSSLVNTIVCMDETEVIGAYLAEELMQAGASVMNSGSEIFVVTPMYNVKRKLIFHHNVQKMIKNQRVLLLVASVSSGRTVARALECLDYYGGKLVGISALFSAAGNDTVCDTDIHPVFTAADIPGYRFYKPDSCGLCKSGEKLDAIVNSEGYTTFTDFADQSTQSL